MCVNQKTFFAKDNRLAAGCDELLQRRVCYKRGDLVPRLKGTGILDNRMAGYGDAVVATAGLLVLLWPPGYPLWLKHEGFDTYAARSAGGREARL